MRRHRSGMLGLFLVGAFVAAIAVSQGDAAARDHPTGEPNKLCDGADGGSASLPASLLIEDLEREVAAGRSSFGWDAGSSVVRELVADPIAWCRGADIGLPITEVEAGELAARSEVQTAALEIADELRAENDADFAGVWLEFNTSTLWISYTSDKVSLADELSARLPNEGRVAFQPARYSYADLEAVAAAVVDARFEVSSPAGVPVFGGGVDEVANSVVVLTDDAGNSDEYGVALGAYADTDSSLFTFETYLGDAELESSAKSGDRWATVRSGHTGGCRSSVAGCTTAPPPVIAPIRAITGHRIRTRIGTLRSGRCRGRRRGALLRCQPTLRRCWRRPVGSLSRAPESARGTPPTSSWVR